MTTDNPVTSNNRKRRLMMLGATLLFILLAIAYGIYYIEVLSQQEETDNA